MSIMSMRERGQGFGTKVIIGFNYYSLCVLRVRVNYYLPDASGARGERQW